MDNVVFTPHSPRSFIFGTLLRSGDGGYLGVVMFRASLLPYTLIMPRSIGRIYYPHQVPHKPENTKSEASTSVSLQPGRPNGYETIRHVSCFLFDFHSEVISKEAKLILVLKTTDNISQCLV